MVRSLIENFAALDLYEKASKLDPADYRPFSNISAVHFEIGQYEKAIEAAVHGLETMEQTEKPGAASNRLTLRLAKARLHIGNYEAVLQMADDVGEAREIQDLKSMARYFQEEQVFVPKSKTGSTAIRHLPRYKPQLQVASAVSNKFAVAKLHRLVVPEYFAVGHDTPQSQFDPPTHENSSDTDTISIFFGGIGDARHLYDSIMHAASREMKRETRRRFHFVLNDLKPVVFARNLVFFLLLDELSEVLPRFGKSPPPKNPTNRTRANIQHLLAVLVFLYAVPVIPPSVHEVLRSTISRALNILENGKCLPTWIHLDPNEIPGIIKTLTSWQGEASPKVSTEYFLRTALLDIRKAKLSRDQLADEFAVPEKDGLQGCAEEKKEFENSGFIPPPPSLLAREPELEKLTKEPPSDDRSTALRNYVTRNWHPNVMFVDIDFINDGDCEVDLGSSPYELAEHIASSGSYPVFPGSKGLFEHCNIFFAGIAGAIGAYKNRITVEFISGDVVEVLEDIQCGLLPDRKPQFPTKFDRIHLSNIP
jgi:Domain of unknown function (DUF4470)